jgi:hypothetical protein
VAEGGKGRLDLEGMRDRRQKRTRRVRRLVKIFVMVAVLFLMLLVLDWWSLNRFREQYNKQTWIGICQFYKRIEDGKVLKVNEEKEYRNLETSILGKEVHVIGRVTEVRFSDPKEGEVEAVISEVLIDVPHFFETVNFHSDDIHLETLEIPGAAPAVGEWVKAWGRVKNFSMYRLRLVGTSLRPLRFYERYYLRKVLPPTRLTREPIGFQKFVK